MPINFVCGHFALLRAHVRTFLAFSPRLYLPSISHSRQRIPRYLWKADRATLSGHSKLPRSLAPSAIPTLISPAPSLLSLYCPTNLHNTAAVLYSHGGCQQGDGRLFQRTLQIYNEKAHYRMPRCLPFSPFYRARKTPRYFVYRKQIMQVLANMQVPVKTMIQR